MGDPVVRRRDGAVAYHLACVVDDIAGGYGRVIRGRDLAASAATQFLIYDLLGASPPVFRHHALLLEPRGDKLAKLHGAVGVPELRAAMTAADLCGWLAWAAGLREDISPCAPRDLVAGFDWAKLRRDDLVVSWDGRRLRVAAA